MINYWKNLIGYQIYIKSFNDSNGDGIGDLNGITAKLDYIKSLGVDFIWICPFYDSPMNDNGYDIRNYFMVSSNYGNMQDFVNLVDEAHKREIKVVIDLVLNHTSDEHLWFAGSEERREPYEDFYIWRDGKVVDGKLLPPNNWQSFFSGPAWKYSEKRGQFYLKLFSDKMPDLNFENPKVFLEIEKIINYYAKCGVDGFRLDAISHIAKEETFADVQKPEKSYVAFSNLPKTHEYLKKMNIAFKLNGMFTMGELGGNPTKQEIIKYTTDGEMDCAFSFTQVGVFTKNNKVDTKKLLNTLKFNSTISKSGGYPVLFWLNHDYPRLASKIKNEKENKNAQICLAGLMYLLKGVPMIYNGEELGMENCEFKTEDDFLDVNAKMLLKNSTDKEKTLKYLIENSRDNSRGVMQWNEKRYAGFSTAKPWIKVGENYSECNVEVEEKNANSVLNNYKNILKVRKSIINLINYAKFTFMKKSKIVGYSISLGKENVFVVANFSRRNVKMRYDTSRVLYSNKEVNGKQIKPYQLLIINRGTGKYNIDTSSVSIESKTRK